MHTYWTSLWYSDTHYSNNLKQNLIIENLIKIFFSYGLLQYSNIFKHNYWFKIKSNAYLSPIKWKRYFRTLNNRNVDFYNDSKLLRNEKKDTYPMKLWIVKFNQWLIINYYWFQPKKNKKYSIKAKNTFVYFDTQKKKNLNLFYRLKVLLIYNFIIKTGKRLKYKF